MAYEDLLKGLDYMTTIVFPAVEATTRSIQQKMIERFNRATLHRDFSDGCKVMAVGPLKGDTLSLDMQDCILSFVRTKAEPTPSKMALVLHLVNIMHPRNSNLSMKTQTLSSHMRLRKF